MSALLLVTPVTTCMACSVQAALPQRHPRPTGQLHDPVQQELLWLGAWHTECAGASAGTWRQSDSSAATGAEPHTGVPHSSICCPTGQISVTRFSYMWFCRQPPRCQKRNDCAFWRQFDEKPSVILGCPAQDATCSRQPLLVRQTTKRCTIQRLPLSRCLCSIYSWLQ